MLCFFADAGTIGLQVDLAGGNPCDPETVQYRVTNGYAFNYSTESVSYQPIDSTQPLNATLFGHWACVDMSFSFVTLTLSIFLFGGNCAYFSYVSGGGLDMIYHGKTGWRKEEEIKTKYPHLDVDLGPFYYKLVMDAIKKRDLILQEKRSNIKNIEMIDQSDEKWSLLTTASTSAANAFPA